LGYVFILGIATLQANAAGVCKHTLLRSPSKLATDLSLRKIISQFEKAGGRGHLINGRSPFSNSEVHDFQVYKIDQLPKSADADSPIQWLRLAQDFAFTQKLLQQGTPLLLVNFPPRNQTGALTITIHEVTTQDILAGDPRITAKSLILIQPNSPKSQLAHELQHWQDNENGVIQNLLKDLKSTFALKFLNSQQIFHIRDSILELRGYSAQEMDLSQDLNELHPTVKDGTIYRGAKAKLALQGQIAEASEIYQRLFADELNQILLLIESKDKTAYKKLISVLKKYELTTPGAISFSKIFGF
jgi:hypothetical protein